MLKRWLRWFRRLTRVHFEAGKLLPSLNAEEEKIWRTWVDRKPRRSSDLLDIVVGAKDVYKKRAIYILLAPNPDCIPFYWKWGTEWTESRGDFYSSVSLELLEYSSQLIMKFQKMISDKDCFQSFYNICLFHLFCHFPHENKAEVLEQYCLVDRWGGSYYYNDIRPEPLTAIFNSNLDFFWMKMADAKARGIIRAYHEKAQEVPEYYKRLLDEYTEMLGFFSSSLWPWHDHVDFFASQINFVISLKTIRSQGGLFKDWYVADILKRLEGPALEDLRYRFSRFIIFRESNSPFRIYCKKTQAAADMIRKEFGERDPELNQRLDQIKAVSELRERQLHERKTVEKTGEQEEVDAENNLLEEMK